MVAAPVFRDIAEQTMAIKEYRPNLRKASLQGRSTSVVEVNESPIQSPDELIGMDASAAIWALERQGYIVSVQGNGRVRRFWGNLNSNKPGQRVTLLLGS
jgi:hypothetical protein